MHVQFFSVAYLYSSLQWFYTILPFLLDFFYVPDQDGWDGRWGRYTPALHKLAVVTFSCDVKLIIEPHYVHVDMEIMSLGNPLPCA